ncbi:peroxide stress protein YaaA [Cognataquiflexum rubidum]|uniref:peroxide stress protein YaaA n=1 Tax=Cognataquiflexum rubidum TaxID=2922273 RepID=UPI001F140217|nr:peroxide stress protein YaaA [Cognataquiflexum rubidum]MCH6235571.1 peroxide stress protein YaaA [Cognataquiflexum rubidum]
MITLISPAKTLDLSSSEFPVYSQPDFQKETFELVRIMKKKSIGDIQDLMGISENLAVLNKHRYMDFQESFEIQNSKQALLAFKGDVYMQLDVENYSQEDFDFAQEKLRILSGLYGLLKPLDLIQPYRLEMGIRLENKKGKNLYEFWGTRIAKAINEAAKGEPIINLASQEYFKAVDIQSLKTKVITPIFQEYRNGKYEVIGLFAKKARGMMTNHIIKNKINDPEMLKTFNEGKYEWIGEEEDGIWRFVR